MTALPLPDVAQASRLTQVLRRAGLLHDDAAVREVTAESVWSTTLTHIARLRLSYDHTDSAAPRSLILKAAHPERAGRGMLLGRREVAFYQRVTSAMPALPVPRCFDASCDEQAQDWYLLLEDLADTHVTVTPWPLPPTLEQCEQIVTARARLHAACWDDPRLGVSIGQWMDEAARDQHLQRLGEAVGHFADRLGDRLPPTRRMLYDQLLDAAPRLFARYETHRNLTILQGDAHVWNCFLARDGGDDTRFFDWDAWSINVGAGDLAHMMTVHWYPDQRRRTERHLLDCYHATLLAHGVRDYDRDALDADYRLSTLWQITWPMWQAAYDVPPVIWWNNLERVLLAVDDLGCRELLG